MKWLDGLDIYIQPSFQEGLPRALVEAMSRGLPALGSSVGGIPELLPSYCLHEPGDSSKLAELLTDVTSASPQRLIEMGTRNFEFVSEYQRCKMQEKRDYFWGKFLREVTEYSRKSGRDKT